MKHVFVSYATSDRAEALAVCDAIERRGVKCWIACRDVEPGENYQEAIVRAIRSARALVLVFSDRANNSDEIKKELSLVSRFRLPLIALRIEDVEPSDAFAYELSTRQWIDLFEDWDRSIESLVRRVGALPTGDGDEPSAPTPAPAAAPTRHAIPPAPPPPAKRKPRWPLFAALALVVVALAGIAALAILLHRGGASAEHPMEVRLVGFQRLSADLPDTLPDAMRDEIISTFQHDGLIGISTAKAPRPGDAPAYSLGGTVRHAGDEIRVIVTLANERTGTTLWSDTQTYPAKQIDRMPRAFALKTSNVVRTALFAASTYPKPLPDEAMALYFQGIGSESPTKQLDLARKLVALLPDYSWGWSAVQGTAASAAFAGGGDAKALIAEAMRAGETALKLDPTNSEALTTKAYLIDANDLAGRDALFKQALNARPLACGCEHHTYAYLLLEMGRTTDAIAELKRSTDVMPLNPSTQMMLGLLLQQAGDVQAAKEHFDAYLDLSTSDVARERLAIRSAPATHAYAAAAAAAAAPGLHLPPATQKALEAAFRALASDSAEAKAAAGPPLAAVVDQGDPELSASLLGALGDYRDAFRIVGGRGRIDDPFFRAVLFLPGMEGAVRDPGFPALADQLGLTRYWRQSKIKPDFCKKAGAPAYCGTL